MAVTLRDIAKHLNLSHATVSFVLNDRRDVAIPETTRARVIQAARELGYRPNRAARALVMGRTQMIALWMPDPSKPFYGRVFQTAYTQLHDHGYETIFCRYDPTGKSGNDAFDQSVDGILAIDTQMDRSVPLPSYPFVVFVGAEPDPRADHVKVDLESGAIEATMHLLDTGRQRIACATALGPLGERTGIARSYENVMRSAGREPEVIVLTDPRREAVRKAIHEHLMVRGAPDGLLCQDDEVAQVANRAFADFGLRLPEEVALVGFGNADWTPYCVPSLTTVDEPVEQICELALGMLLARIANPNAEIQSVQVPTSIIVRESTRIGMNPVANVTA